MSVVPSFPSCLSLLCCWLLLPLHRCTKPVPCDAGLCPRSAPRVSAMPTRSAALLCQRIAMPRPALPVLSSATPLRVDDLRCPCKALSRFAYAVQGHAPCRVVRRFAPAPPRRALPALCESMPWLRESEPPPSAAPLHRPSMLRRCSSWLSVALPPLVTAGLCPCRARLCVAIAFRSSTERFFAAASPTRCRPSPLL